MNAMRAAALPHYDTGSVRPRPHLRVVYSAEGPEAASRPAPGRPAVSRPATGHLAPSPLAPSPLRLTRRGRVVVAAAAALLVVMVSLIAAGAAQAISHSASSRAAGQGLAHVAVRPGESLWSVAETADPDADTRVVVQQIIQMNSLTGDTVFAGERLWVPRG